jgi:CheY-like chemotaxis protein
LYGGTFSATMPVMEAVDTGAAPPRLLIVDDETSLRLFSARAAEDAGYQVATAADGPEALRIVETMGRFDLYMVDLMMPLMRGDELAKRLRANDPGARVLYFTGYSDTLFEGRETLLETEAFIEKPIRVNGLLEAISLQLFGHTRGILLPD